MDHDTRIAELEARVEALQQQLGERGREASPDASVGQPTSSRRGMLKLAGAAAAGAVASTVSAGRAAAIDNSALTVGDDNSALRRTYLGYGNFANADGPVLATEATMMWVDNRNSPNSSANGLRGDGRSSGSGLWGNNDFGGTGVRGESTSGTGVSATSSTGYGLTAISSTGPAGVVGFGTDGVQGWATGDAGYGVSAVFSGKASMFLRTTNDFLGSNPKSAPPTRGDSHVVGELETDSTGALWFCVASGTPGTWRKLASPQTGGAFHPVTPFRVFDSRLPVPAPGGFTPSTNRTISVADSRDVTTGAVVAANAIPVGATAIACQITVIGVTGSGFLAVNPGGTTAVTAASVNWRTPDGATLNNGIIAALNANRQVTIVCGGGAGASCNATLDITGYWR
jgi:hypothetical protein